MPDFSTTFTITRPIEAVFDMAMTARYWPQWHPATVSVAGAVDHPARLGDTITERVNLSGQPGEGRGRSSPGGVQRRSPWRRRPPWG